MLELIQTLWDQMKADLHTGEMSQIHDACQTLLRGDPGPLTELQTEDLESVDRSLAKLIERAEGEPIDWADYSEAAHALRGPLNATIGFSRLIIKGIDGPITEAQKEPLETIYNGSRRMLTLFNLLLDALTLVQGDMDFGLELISVNEILGELTTVGETLAAKRDYIFAADVTALVAKITIQGNAKRLKQVLLALLAVSAKYLGGDVLTLRVRTTDDKLLIQLENQGCQPSSLLPDDPSRLLTNEAPTAILYDIHLRLGLAWHMLNGMKGRLEIHRAGETCTFSVTVPLAQ